ncbi:DUF4157 domain-containing protein [Pelatocladus sp. BLCC-F211]
MATSPTYGSLSAVVQRVQQDPNTVNGDERQQLESAIGTRSIREILAGKKTPWVPQFQGISAQLWGDAGQVGEPIQAKGKDDVGASEVQPENKTGLPDQLKAGIENLSGMAMDDVKVHYNSSKPPELQALAYTQGTDIHVAPGQEKHLPHEAWHVVQQMQGRVKPTIQMKEVGINDDARLEREADVMGEKAEREEYQSKSTANDLRLNSAEAKEVSPIHPKQLFLTPSNRSKDVIQRSTLRIVKKGKVYQITGRPDFTTELKKDIHRDADKNGEEYIVKFSQDDGVSFQLPTIHRRHKLAWSLWREGVNAILRKGTRKDMQKLQERCFLPSEWQTWDRDMFKDAYKYGHNLEDMSKDFFNHPDNVWLGPGDENMGKGAGLDKYIKDYINNPTKYNRKKLRKSAYDPRDKEYFKFREPNPKKGKKARWSYDRIPPSPRSETMGETTDLILDSLKSLNYSSDEDS